MPFKTFALLALVALPSLAQERWPVGLNLNSPNATSKEYQPPDGRAVLSSGFTAPG
jgi:hypothetical protein